MSDSELSDTQHDDHALEQELRQVVRGIYKSGELEELTFKRVRVAAEHRLGLKEGFYKSDAWKSRSKDIIGSEVSAQEGSSKPRASNPAASPKSKPKPTEKLDGLQQPSNHGRTKSKATKAHTNSSSELSDVDNISEKSGKAASAGEQKETTVDQSDSDLSELIDDDPVPKKRKKDSSGKSAKPAKQPKTKPKKGKGTEADPDAEEIKKLQGWLAKCGVRKLWGKELKPFETPKAKITYLKHMLIETGMTGRFSIEKAQRIREARELQADLEAVQEGAKYWGKSDDEQERSGRKRRLARGFEVRRRTNVDEDDEPAAIEASEARSNDGTGGKRRDNDSGASSD